MFLKRLVQKVLANSGQYPEGIRPVHLDVMDLSTTLVRREWQNIDILCVDEQNRLAVLIENKIDSTERIGQLEKYLDIVKYAYPGFVVIPLFLSPQGIEPSVERYIAADYSLVCETLQHLLVTRKSVIRPDVFTTISHYVEMLRRHVMSESEIAKIARSIYDKHRTALDLIFEHRPDEQSDWAARFQELIRSEKRLDLDHSSKSYVRFFAREWDVISEFKCGMGWTPSNRILLFEFRNFPPDGIKLHLLIGPAELHNEPIRQRLFSVSQANRAVFRGGSKSLARKWATIWSQPFLSAKDFEIMDMPDRIEKVDKEWRRFVDHDLPIIVPDIGRILMGRV